MKKIILSALLTAGLVGSAFAQAVSGDIILGFRDTANSGAGNLMINLGNANSLLTSANGGSVLLTNLTNSGVYGSNTVDSLFGAGWNTSATLKWAAAGTVNTTDTTNPNGVKNTLFATKISNDLTLGVADNTTTWNRGTTTVQNGASTLITPMYTSFGSGSFRQVAVGGTGAWSKQEVPTSGSTYFGYFASGATVLENATNIAGSYVSSDLWRMNPTNNGGDGLGVFLGTLAIYGNGDVTFTSFQAIPEPSTYAALLGVVTLGVVGIRRRQAALEAV